MKNLLFFFSLIIFACSPTVKKNSKYNIENFKNSDTLSYYLDSIPKASDSIFLRFNIGMTKSEFRNHIKDLRAEGLDIRFKKTIKMGIISLKDCYVYYTPIYYKPKYGDKKYTGNGVYSLSPIYKNGVMEGLTILIEEEWDEFSFSKSWLKDEVYAKYSIPDDQVSELNVALMAGVRAAPYNWWDDEFQIASNTLVIQSMLGGFSFRSMESMVVDAINVLKKQEAEIKEAKKANSKI